MVKFENAQRLTFYKLISLGQENRPCLCTTMSGRLLWVLLSLSLTLSQIPGTAAARNNSVISKPRVSNAFSKSLASSRNALAVPSTLSQKNLGLTKFGVCEQNGYGGMYTETIWNRPHSSIILPPAACQGECCLEPGDFCVRTPF